MQLVSLVLPSFWAPALINDDWSGLNDEEEANLKRWLNLNHDLSYCLTCDDDKRLVSYHDASNVTGNLLIECVNYHFEKVSPKH